MAALECDLSKHLSDSSKVATAAPKKIDNAFNDAYNLTPQTAASAESKIIRDDNCPESVATGIPIHKWESASAQSKGIVVALHGSMGDSLSYEGIARYLAAKDFTFVSMGLRGHDSYFYSPTSSASDHAFNCKQSSEDLSSLLLMLKHEYPGKPIFCLGESIGAAIAARSASKHPELVDGLILSSPGTKPQHYGLRYVMPDIVNGIRHPKRELDVTRYIKSYSSDNPEIVKEMLADPLSRKSMTPHDMLNTTSFLHSATNTYKHLNANIPILVVQGALDHVLVPESAKTVFLEVKSTDKQMVTLPDSGHIILQTTKIKPLAKDTVTNWLNEHAAALQATQPSYAHPKIDL